MTSHKIHLHIESTSGRWNHPFDNSDRAQVVLNAAIEHFKLHTGPGVTYVLKRSDGTVLALSESLHQLGLHEGETILLQTLQAQDG